MGRKTGRALFFPTTVQAECDLCLREWGETGVSAPPLGVGFFGDKSLAKAKLSALGLLRRLEC